MSKVRIRTHRPWIAYPGSPVQQNYAEELRHGFLLWDIKSKEQFDVRFCELPNPRPFVTVDWAGTVEATLEASRVHPMGARFRIRNRDVLPQKEVAQLTLELRNEMKASEVTFKSERRVNRDVISAGSTTLVKADLRNPDVLMRLLREYHKEAGLSDDEWSTVKDQVTAYLQQALDGDDVVRNTKWSLRHVAWDNTFAYGKGNAINFDQAAGVVGIFGPNARGKSSVVGTILYGLFNTTDRGNVKNLHVINVRHPYCYTRSVVNVNGTNHSIERQTVRYETKKGQNYAGTQLNVFRIAEDGSAHDLAGEQRNDTEKVIRRLIGTPEDCLLTSVAAQDDVKLFINQGTTKRRKDLSRFLDLDIFDKMHELAKLDVNANKAALKQLPDRDWQRLEASLLEALADHEAKIRECDRQLHQAGQDLADVQAQLAAFKDFKPVTQNQVDQQRHWVADEEVRAQKLRTELEQARDQIADRQKKAQKVDSVLADNDLDALKKRLESLRTLESSLEALKATHERDAALLKQQEKSLKILDDVPCGDSYPGCKFIKDAFKQKDRVDPQRDRVQRALERVQKAEESLAVLKADDLPARVSKLEQLRTMKATLATEVARLEVTRDRKEHDLVLADARLEDGRRRLSELEEALRNEENAEVVALRNRLDGMQRSAKAHDSERLRLAAEVGRTRSDLAKMEVDRRRRLDVLQAMRVHELVVQAYSRRGIPSLIVASQLPAINAEIAQILAGIVNFTVELEQDDDSDSMEVFIDYGDSRRIIELASGMEKTIASIAIRVALINVTSLPKTDMFIIDEAFGPLDPTGVEACNRLLVSLKRYFRVIVVITHVEGIKDVADHVIEVGRVESDARVLYDDTWPKDRTSATG